MVVSLETVLGSEAFGTLRAGECRLGNVDSPDMPDHVTAVLIRVFAPIANVQSVPAVSCQFKVSASQFVQQTWNSDGEEGIESEKFTSGIVV